MAAAFQTAVPLRVRYDRGTIALHWLTALLVICLFASAEVWGFLQRGTAPRHSLQLFHVSLGILLAVVIVLRVAWRLTHRHDLTSNLPRYQEVASAIMHGALYLLLIAQVCLGFLFRWAQGEEFTFFGLFTVPPVAVDSTLRSTFGQAHNFVAWTIIVLAGLHALAALGHHYVLKDGVLRRMMPRSN